MALRLVAATAEQRSPLPAHRVAPVTVEHEFFGPQIFYVRQPVKGLPVPDTLEGRQALGAYLAGGVAATIRENKHTKRSVDYVADLHIGPDPLAAQQVWEVLGALAVMPGLVEKTPDMLWAMMLRPFCSLLGLHLLVPICSAIEKSTGRMFVLGGTLSAVALYNVVRAWHACRVERRTANEYFTFVSG